MPAEYILKLTDVINNIGDKTKLTYSYTCTGTGCSNKTSTQVPNDDFILNTRTINPGVTNIYTVTFTYNGTPTGNFTGRFDFETVKNTLIASTGLGDTRYFWYHKLNITSVTFENVINIPVGVTSWDVSSGKNESVMAYITDDGLGTGTYKLYIQANGEIIANSNSWYLFGLFSKLTQINNLELLDTSKVTDMSHMFRVVQN